jgi:DNA repair exonuclease SbcCD ATPase subunit
MYLQKIRIERFKSIYDPLTIDFEEVNGFWRINGPVGAGKTTIGEAIIFGLFGDVRGKNNSALISWGEKNACVEVWCTSRGHSIYIKRVISQSSASPTYVEIDGDEMVATNKRDIQHQLAEEYYDISRITMELLCIISFNGFKSLATLNTQDSKQFLDQVFGFYILSNYVDRCKNERTLVRNSMNEKNSQIYAITSQINKIEQISEMARIEGDLNKVTADIVEKDAQIKQCNNKIFEINTRYGKEIGELNQKLAEIKALGTNKAKEIKFIEQGKCPTCGAPIDQSQLEIKKREKEALLEQYAMIDKQIKDRRTEQNNEVALVNTDLVMYNSERDELNKQKTRLIEQEKRAKINKGEITKLKKDLKDENKELDTLKADEQQWNELIDILSSDIRNKIMSSFIPLLNTNIGYYTSQLQLPYIVVFDDNFKCSVNLQGFNQPISISSLSTGQLKIVDISIILGVLKTIMSSSNFNVCLLDELLSNMDADLRQLICKVLKENIRDNQTIFIISHTEFEDKNFDGVINTKLIYRDNIHRSSKFEITKFTTPIL